MATVIPNRYGLFRARLTGPGLAADDSTVTIGLHRVDRAAAEDFTPAECFAQARLSFQTFLSASLFAGWAYVKSEYTYREDGVLMAIEASESVVGTGTGVAPAYTSLVVQKRTGVVGRRYRGRMSLPGCLATAGVTTDGAVDASTLATYNSRLATLFNNLEFEPALPLLGGNAVYPVVLHSDGTPPTRVTSLVASPLVGINKTRYR